ncbi:LuxR C-terminal-related transcriptional regulator [Nocardioides sp. YIM 152315]|uniref:LuxR C-terminal-related transcriptional regulator n=1 Tax=Nocardioides sp. YIM 152315 TaxID=3031760 RepID=UPI0023DBE8CB|nr:LuxR C-terminal-related transcriptional regulator [Nocardioides sp. YIM 152315]
MSKRVQRGSSAQIGRVPRLPRVYVPRQRLWSRLDTATESAVTLLVGPGGSGKTLGVAGWLRRTGRADDATWITVADTWGPDRLLPHLARRTGDDRPALVVVDDAHRLPLATIRALDGLLDTDPDSLRVLLASRWDLPFRRLAPELLGHLTLLRGDLLRLDDEETSALVAAHTRTGAADVTRAIARRTQGWCAAVVLTARAVGAAPDPVELAQRYAEGGPSVADRVASEVFATLRPRERHLLLCVANEPVVTPALAEHLSHDSESGAILADLGATGLLVTRVDTPEPDDGGVPVERYTIHPLLAEVVRRRISAGGVDVMRASATVQRAVHLDVARGVTEDALHRLEAIGEHDVAAALVAEEGPRLLLRGHGAPIHDFAAAHPSAIEVNPGSWFAVALERWFVNDVHATVQWLERILHEPQPDTTVTVLRVACARLMRARLGLESMAAAVEHAQRVVADPELTADGSAVVPILLCELAITQNWTGDLVAAEDNLGAAVRLSRTHDLPALTAVALSHLAFTEYMRGRESSAAEVAELVLALVAERGFEAPYSVARARLARQLAELSGLPLRRPARTLDDGDLPTHAADLATRFWTRTRRARVELARGSVSGAEIVLETPLETPPLPAHLAVALLVERAFLASLSGDAALLDRLHEQLVELGASAEAALVSGLRADLTGDRRAAARRLAEAAGGPAVEQPAVRALALVTRAQLLDGLGEADQAMEELREALRATQVRKNAVPFLGWSRHGTPVPELMQRLVPAHGDPWLIELDADIAGLSGIASYFGPSTARPREREGQRTAAVRPTLSPRERDVLFELARGATYADIAANLFVSENTVKTHVSSLYAKLSVNRRSDALAAARAMQLL